MTGQGEPGIGLFLAAFVDERGADKALAARAPLAEKEIQHALDAQRKPDEAEVQA